MTTRTARSKGIGAAKPATNRAGFPDAPVAKRPIIVAVLLLAVGVVAAIAIALTVGGEATETTVGNPVAHLPGAPLAQVAPAQLRGSSLPTYDAGTADAAVGLMAPAIAASYFDDEQVVIEPGDGTPKVLLFVAHWCPHCQAEIPALTQWFEINGVPTDVEIIAVSTSADEGAPNYPPSSWLLREEWPTPAIRDSVQQDLATGYGLSAFPYVVGIDAEGSVVRRATGGLPMPQWEALLDAVRR